MYSCKKTTKQVNLRADLVLENVETIWVQIEQGDQRLVSNIYRPHSATLEYYERMIDVFEFAGMTEDPVIYLGDLNLNWILDSDH